MQQDLSFIKQQANDWLVKLETDSMTDGDEDSLCRMDGAR